MSSSKGLSGEGLHVCGFLVLCGLPRAVSLEPCLSRATLMPTLLHEEVGPVEEAWIEWALELEGPLGQGSAFQAQRAWVTCLRSRESWRVFSVMGQSSSPFLACVPASTSSKAPHPPKDKARFMPRRCRRLIAAQHPPAVASAWLLSV